MKGQSDLLKELIEKYGAIPAGEKPSREVQVPRKSSDGKKVSQTVRTILEAEATPDEALPTIEQLVTDGEFSYDVYTDKAAISEATAELEKEGYPKAFADWLKSVEKGSVSKKNTATGWALYNNAVNGGDMKTAMTILNKMVQHQLNFADSCGTTLRPRCIVHRTRSGSVPSRLRRSASNPSSK